jgi:hypothetical protein
MALVLPSQRATLTTSCPHSQVALLPSWTFSALAPVSIINFLKKKSFKFSVTIMKLQCISYMYDTNVTNNDDFIAAGIMFAVCFRITICQIFNFINRLFKIFIFVDALKLFTRKHKLIVYRVTIMPLFKGRAFILSISPLKWSCAKGPFTVEFSLRCTNFVSFYSRDLDCCQMYEHFLSENELLSNAKKSSKYD